MKNLNEYTINKKLSLRQIEDLDVEILSEILSNSKSGLELQDEILDLYESLQDFIDFYQESARAGVENGEYISIKEYVENIKENKELSDEYEEDKIEELEQINKEEEIKHDNFVENSINKCNNLKQYVYNIFKEKYNNKEEINRYNKYFLDFIKNDFKSFKIEIDFKSAGGFCEEIEFTISFFEYIISEDKNTKILSFEITPSQFQEINKIISK